METKPEAVHDGTPIPAQTTHPIFYTTEPKTFSEHMNDLAHLYRNATYLYDNIIDSFRFA